MKRLQGKNKINRMRELMSNTLNESSSKFEVEITKKGPDGRYYAIIRENSKYYIKVSDSTSDVLVAEDFKYVGGLGNKLYKYDSYSKAIKNLDLKFKSLKEAYNSDMDINTFKNDNLLEHHGMRPDAPMSDTKGVGDSEEYIHVAKGEDLSYENGEEKIPSSEVGGDFGDEKMKHTSKENTGSPRKNGQDDVMSETFNIVGFGEMSIFSAMDELENDVKKKV